MTDSSCQVTSMLDVSPSHSFPMFRSHTDSLGKHPSRRTDHAAGLAFHFRISHSTLQTLTCSEPDFFCTTNKRPKLYSQLPEVFYAPPKALPILTPPTPRETNSRMSIENLKTFGKPP
jgi:hypothetical protein